MKRLFAVLAGLALVASAAFSPPASSQEASAGYPKGSELGWQTIVMRSTSASAVAREPNWTEPQFVTIGFADSNVFRRAAGTGTVYDTSCAYPRTNFPLPPNLGPTVSNALIDTSSVPWIVLRVRQDSLSTQYGATPGALFVGTTGMDSVRVGIEYSWDGISWFSCPGTPTRRFDVVYFTSGQDGLQNPSLIGVEASPGEDAAIIQISCHPSQASSNAFIVNRTACFAGNFIRFLVGFAGDGVGQFVLEAVPWKQN